MNSDSSILEILSEVDPEVKAVVLKLLVFKSLIEPTFREAEDDKVSRFEEDIFLDHGYIARLANEGRTLRWDLGLDCSQVEGGWAR